MDRGQRSGSEGYRVTRVYWVNSIEQRAWGIAYKSRLKVQSKQLGSCDARKLGGWEAQDPEGRGRRSEVGGQRSGSEGYRVTRVNGIY